MILDSKLRDLRGALEFPINHTEAVKLAKEILEDTKAGAKLPAFEEMLPIVIYPGLFEEACAINGLLLVETTKRKTK